MFVESKSCIDCIKEIETKIIDKLKEIIRHRQSCRKCTNCYRLEKAEQAIKNIRVDKNAK